MQIETELRNKNENLQNTCRQSEFQNRQKDEEIMALKRMIEKSDRDVKSLAWLESQLKMEVSQLKQKRVEAEDQLQSSKQQLSAS